MLGMAPLYSYSCRYACYEVRIEWVFLNIFETNLAPKCCIQEANFYNECTLHACCTYNNRERCLPVHIQQYISYRMIQAVGTSCIPLKLNTSLSRYSLPLCQEARTHRHTGLFALSLNKESRKELLSETLARAMFYPRRGDIFDVGVGVNENRYNRNCRCNITLVHRKSTPVNV